MKDMQGESDDRAVPIDSVGVSGLRWPIVVWDRQRERQNHNHAAFAEVEWCR